MTDLEKLDEGIRVAKSERTTVALQLEDPATLLADYAVTDRVTVDVDNLLILGDGWAVSLGATGKSHDN